MRVEGGQDQERERSAPEEGVKPELGKDSMAHSRCSSNTVGGSPCDGPCEAEGFKRHPFFSYHLLEK